MTKVVKVNPLNPEAAIVQEAARVLKTGGLVIIPTETVYGIAANTLSPQAMEKLSGIKERPEDKPFSLHVARKEEIEEFARDIPIAAYKLISRFWPGPLTVVLSSKDGGTVGMRMPDNRVALEVIAAAGVPVVCPSANLSGKPAPQDFSDALKDLLGKVELAIDAGKTSLGKESTVVGLTAAAPLKILREGFIKKEEIEEVASKKTVLFVCTGNSCRSVMAKALLEKKLKEKKRADVEVLSAGIMSAAGLGASESTREILRRQGIDVSAHRAQKASWEMLKKSDLILVMESLQEQAILEICPEVKKRVFLLKEFAKIEDSDLSIEDPIGQPPDFYEKTFCLINEAVERISNIL